MKYTAVTPCHFIDLSLVFPRAGMHWSNSCDNLHILSHLLIFTSFLTPSHLGICSSSHLLVFHIFSSAHLLIFTFAPLDTCSLYTFFHTVSSSHLTFSSSHLLAHVLLPSHLPLSFLSLSLSPVSRPLFSLSPSLSFYPFARNVGRSAKISHEVKFDSPKQRFNHNFTSLEATLSHDMRVGKRKLK